MIEIEDNIASRLRKDSLKLKASSKFWREWSLTQAYIIPIHQGQSRCRVTCQFQVVRVQGRSALDSRLVKLSGIRIDLMPATLWVHPLFPKGISLKRVKPTTFLAFSLGGIIFWRMTKFPLAQGSLRAGIQKSITAKTWSMTSSWKGQKSLSSGMPHAQRSWQQAL